MEGDAPSMKKFLTEKEIEEARQKRQEEWEKARQSRPNLPSPDEVDRAAASGKTLYEQLQLQKQKKDDEFLESKKFKNMIRGLDDEESAYLDTVSRKQMVEERNRIKEQEELINELKKQQATQQISAPSTIEPLKKEVEKPKVPPPQSSISNLIKQAVKRKADPPAPENKDETSKDGTKKPPCNHHPIQQVIGVLPSIVSAYADSDNEEGNGGCCSDSDDSDASTSSSDCDVSCNAGHSHGNSDDLASFRPSITPALMRRLRRELQGGEDE